MSVLFTESFMRYQRRAVAPATAGEVNDDIIAGGLALASYNINLPSAPPNSNMTTTHPTAEVVADPIYGSRNALRTRFNQSGNRTTALRCGFPVSGSPTHVIFGARMRLAYPTAAQIEPHTFISHLNVAKPAVSGNTEAAAFPANAWEAILRVDHRTGITYTGVSGSYVAVTSFVMPTDSDVYVEVEIDTVNNLVRVWVDDLLLIDSAFSAPNLATASAAFSQGLSVYSASRNTSTSSTGFFSAVTFRDIYCLAVDAVAPFQRLGPTTQVIGELPTDDAEVDFTRPGGYASNAEVAALPVVLNPSDYLTADQVGQTDLYSVATSEVATAASQVYAVGIKTQVANFAAAAHTVGAVVRSGAVPVTDTESLGSITPGAGFVNRAAYFTENPDTEAAWTPQEAADAEFGLTVLS